MKNNTTVASWIFAVKQHPITGNLFVELPISLTSSLKWEADDSLLWTPQKDGSFKVSKVQKKK